jgi:hypothetical protein
MREDLDQQLCEKYPKIFANRHGDMKETAMCWGLSCGDGWYNIIDTLCANIQSHIDWSIKNHRYDVVNNTTSIRPAVKQVVAVQVKEKFGGLRFYYDGGDDYIRGLSSMAESMSIRTCEECGSPGQQRNGGWVRTLCDYHEEEHQRKIKLRDQEYEQRNYKFVAEDSGTHD